jgi:acetylglutamate synthase
MYKLLIIQWKKNLKVLLEYSEKNKNKTAKFTKWIKKMLSCGDSFLKKICIQYILAIHKVEPDQLSQHYQKWEDNKNYK